jgi:hypothetical protein
MFPIPSDTGRPCALYLDTRNRFHRRAASFSEECSYRGQRPPYQRNTKLTFDFRASSNLTPVSQKRPEIDAENDPPPNNRQSQRVDPPFNNAELIRDTPRNRVSPSHYTSPLHSFMTAMAASQFQDPAPSYSTHGAASYSYSPASGHKHFTQYPTV